MIPYITSIHIYPIKSLGGISVEKGILTKTGLQYDRQWMLVDQDGVFLSQRNHSIMALFKLKMNEDSITVRYEDQSIDIPLVEIPQNEKISVSVWDDKLQGSLMGKKYDDFFSKIMKMAVRMVQKPTTHFRPVKNHTEIEINFSDACQILIAGKPSLRQLNSKLEHHINMNRFRANIIYDGDTAHEDDGWREININDNQLSYVKPCARCRIVMTDQETAELDKAPFMALSQYRKINNKVYFGTYYSIQKNNTGLIQVGDPIKI